MPVLLTATGRLTEFDLEIERVAERIHAQRIECLSPAADTADASTPGAYSSVRPSLPWFPTILSYGAPQSSSGDLTGVRVGVARSWPMEIRTISPSC